MNLKDIFDFTHSAGDSWYTKVLLGRKKVEHCVVLMVGEDFFKHSFSTTYIRKQVVKSKVKLKDRKTKFPLPYIDLIRKKGMGNGRVLMCYREGIKEVPVLIVGEIKKWVKEIGIKVAEM